MKSNNRTVIWGTLLGFGLFGMMWVFAIEFPNVHLPIGQGGITFTLVTALLITILISAYRSLLKRVGYWLLLFALLALHVGCCALFFLRQSQDLAPLQLDVRYGMIGGAEFIVFALVVLKIYRVGPRIDWL